MTNEVLKLELEKKEIDVILTSDGVDKKFTLKELSGRDRNKYLNKMTNRVKIDGKGKALGIKTFDGFQSDLLQVSLFDESGEAVTVDEIEEMPSSTQLKLFEAAQKLSGLDNDEEADSEKN